MRTNAKNQTQISSGAYARKNSFVTTPATQVARIAKDKRIRSGLENSPPIKSGNDKCARLNETARSSATATTDKTVVGISCR